MWGTWRGNAMAGTTTAGGLREPDARARYPGHPARTVKRPLIGISSYGRAGERQTFSLPCEYVDVVRLAGGVPIVLPAVEGEIPEALGAIEALILPGGGDVDPAHYGGVRHEANYGISPGRASGEHRAGEPAGEHPRRDRAHRALGAPPGGGPPRQGAARRRVEPRRRHRGRRVRAAPVPDRRAVAPRAGRARRRAAAAPVR